MSCEKSSSVPFAGFDIIENNELLKSISNHDEDWFSKAFDIVETVQSGVFKDFDIIEDVVVRNANGHFLETCGFDIIEDVQNDVLASFDIVEPAY